MLSEVAFEILSLIDESTEWEGSDRPGFTLRRYWIPRIWEYSTLLKKQIVASGPGAASAIKGLMRRGLVKSIPNVHPYGCAITEEGMIALEEYREAHIYNAS